MVLYLFLLALSASTVFCKVNVGVHDCGSHGGHINSITVMECDAEPCVIHRGHNYTILVNFTTSHAISEAHTVLHGGWSFLSLPFPITPENACQGSLPCPLLAGQTYLYNVHLQCPSFAPSFRITSKWELKDGHGQNLLCFAVPLSIHS